jgi:signal peptidase II
MMLKIIQKYFYKNLFFYSFLILLSDQITKILILKNFEIYQSIEITSFLNIVLVFNTGAAFSIFSDGHDWQRYMLLVSTIVIIIFLIYYLHRHIKNNWLQELSIYLIISGAIGNLIDRIRLGMVVDFIDFHIGDFHWPAFNIADSAISIGAMTLIFLELRFLILNKKGPQKIE